MRRHSLYTSSFKETMNFILMLFLVAATFMLWILYMMPQYSNEYTASILDKVERLESINEPKIILVGNSNVPFGIDSEALEETFNMPVVDMGLHGSLGNAFHENIAKFNVNKGDIVIVAHTTYYDTGVFGDPVLGWITLEDHWHLWNAVDYKMMRQLIDSFPIYLKKVINLWSNEKGNLIPTGIYARTSFNEYGDIGVSRTESKLDVEKATVQMPSVEDDVTERLNQLNEYFTDRGAVMLIAAYPILNTSSTPDRQEFLEFQEKLENAMDASVISEYTDYFFEPQYFYDVNYHLTDEGTVLRTNLLIEDIKRWDKQQIWVMY